MHNPIILDLGFGDAGKGTFVDYLANERSVVVRYNGGAQCAHNVVTPEGVHHTFAQFGSGTLRGARTHLSRFTLINPLNMLTEERHLAEIGIPNAFGLTTVDPRAMVITPFHIAVNRLKEMARGADRHGSTGQGIGEARADILGENGVLHVGDILTTGLAQYLVNSTRARMLTKARKYYDRIVDNPDAEREWETLNNIDTGPLLVQYRRWARLVGVRPDRWLRDCDGRLIFEGAQGVLLDETHGFQPHTTWTNTTAANALTLLAENHLVGHTVGVIRTYMTRHGAGPFPSEDPVARPEVHNGLHGYAGAWRTGPLDLPLLRYAIDVCGEIGLLAVSHVDRVTGSTPVVVSYTHNGHHVTEVDPDHIWEYVPVTEMWEPEGFVEHVAEELQVPLAVISCGPTRDKQQFAVV